MAEVLTPDLCIIGAGSGGLQAAAAARALDASVVLVERRRMGGGDLNTGTVPSKALLAAAEHAQAARSGAPFGIATEEPRVHWRRLHDHVTQVIAEVAPQRSGPRFEALGARLVEAEAKFTDARTVAAGDTVIRARRFIIATGARPVVPAIPGLETIPYFTSETIFDNTRKLTHLVIIGAGPLGVELAQAYTRLGTQVTVVEAATPLGAADPELAEVALRRMQEEGVVIRSGTRVTAVQGRSQGIGVVIADAEGERTLDASHVLVATGRAPNLDGLELEAARIRRAPDDPQRLALSRGLRTSNRRVYAIGDVAGGPQMAHLADHQARLVVRRALLGALGRQRPESIPTATFTDPEIASVGLTEAAARRRHGDAIRIVRCPFAENDRARTTRQTYGLAKLVTDRGGRILGAGIVGAGAAETIALLALAIDQGLTARQLRDVPLPYPTRAEIVNLLGAEFHRQDAPTPLAQAAGRLRRLLP